MSYDMFWVEVDRRLLDGAEEALQHQLEVHAQARVELDAIGSAWDPVLNPHALLSEQEQAIVARWEGAREACLQARPFHFQLNNRGMGRCRQLMHRSGMAVDSHQPGRWPGPRHRDPSVRAWIEEHGVGATCRRDRDRPAEPPEVTAYLDEHAAWRRGHGTDLAGIPMHKLSSNEGWHVTPGEIQPALDHAPEVATWPDPETGRDEPVPWWVSWLQYLRAAAGHGGFEVW